jgi:ketosteroid isomerase-like protein
MRAKLIAVGFAILALSIPAEAQQTDSVAVVSTINRFHEALAAGDTSAALELLTPDVIVLEAGGVETREEYRSHHLPGDIAFARAVQSERKLVIVSVRGDVAWVTATSTTKGTYRDRQIDSVGAELMVLLKTNGSWRISAIHWSSRRRT